MTGPQHSEMSSIQSGQLGFAQSLHNRKDGRVDEADVGVSILIAEFTHPPIVGDIQFLNLVCTSVNVVEQAEQDSGIQALVDPVVNLDEYGGGNHQSLTGVMNETSAQSMCSIVAIERCVQRTCVED